MNRYLFRTVRLIGAATLVLAGSACSDEDPASVPPTTVVLTNRSVTPALLKSLVPGVDIYSLVGSDDVLAQSPAFVFGGSADGAGLIKNSDETFTAIVNHEDNFSVSRITFDNTFKPIKGEYIVNSTNGKYRLCSGSLATMAEHGFGPLYFAAGESSEESQILAINPFGSANTPTYVTGFGRWNTENAVPLPKTAYAGKTVILLGDDDSSAEGGQLAMYVTNTVGDLTNGKVYALSRTNDNVRERDMVIGQTYPVVFREIAGISALTGRQVNLAAATNKAMAFGRLEDIDYRKDGVGREVYFTVTGQNTTGVNAAYDRTKYGRVYRVTLDATDPLKGNIELLMDGDDRTGPARLFQNPDNIFVGTNYVYVQEDDNGYGDEAHDAYIYQYNIGTKELKPVLQLDHRRTQADAALYNNVGARAADKAGWEYGAMIDVSTQLGTANTFMIALQPHSWNGAKYVNPDGGTVRPDENQASQLVIVKGLPALMRKVMVGAAALFVSAAACSSPRPVERHAETIGSQSALRVREGWVADLDTLAQALNRLDSALVTFAVTPSGPSQALAAELFLDARLVFKRTEFLSAYYEPSTTKAMNGPPLPRVEEDEGPEVVFPPEGFQVIEELLFAEPDSARLARASHETRNVIDYVTRLRTAASRQFITDDRVFDAAKVEIARIVSLGISGFDSPLARQSLPEAAASLRGVHRAMGAYRDALSAAQWAKLDDAFGFAIARLDASRVGDPAQRAKMFDDFDRLGFIVDAANPLARAVVQARDQLELGTPVERRAFRMEAVTLFDSGAFSAEAFAPTGAVPASASQVALGRALFFEPRLSHDATRACASCHDPARAFTDGLARSVARSKGVVLRNAPTMINAGLQLGSFYDLRATYLEDQVTDVLGNADEMHGNADATAALLATDSAYSSRFEAAFPGADTIRGKQLRSAIASYVRSLQALDSRVDKALRGDTAAIDAEERLGFNLFMGKALCGTCHFAPLFNGTVPPTYQDSEVEVLGVPSTLVTRAARVDADPGRFKQTRAAPHRHAFKVPTVRNVALTAPYMHNGVYRTLDEVVDFYNRGGGAGIGVRLPNQTLPPDSLGLSLRERRALVRLLGALTDTAGTTRLK